MRIERREWNPAAWAALATLALPLTAAFGLARIPALMPAARGAHCFPAAPSPARLLQRRRTGALQLRADASVDAALLLAVVVAKVGTTFEAQPPPLGTTLAVLGSTGGVLAYWWLVLVPSERRDLAKNKNKGGLNVYLDGLEKSDPTERKLEKWFYTEWLERRARVQRIAASNAAKRLATSSSARTTTSSTTTTTTTTTTAVLDPQGVTVTQEDLDKAEEEEEEAGSRELANAREREIENAIPMPRFFSLDNPIVIALCLVFFLAAFGGSGR